MGFSVFEAFEDDDPSITSSVLRYVGAGCFGEKNKCRKKETYTIICLYLYIIITRKRMNDCFLNKEGQFSVPTLNHYISITYCVKREFC